MRAPLYPGLPKHLVIESADLQDAFGDDLAQYAGSLNGLALRLPRS
jgi:hypothetical protein